MLNYLDSNPHRGFEWESDINPELLEIIVRATGITIKNLPARTEAGEFVLVDHYIPKNIFQTNVEDIVDNPPKESLLGSGDIGHIFKPNGELSAMDLSYCGIGDEPDEEEDMQNKSQAPKITIENGLVITDEVCIDLDDVLYSSLRNLN